MQQSQSDWKIRGKRMSSLMFDCVYFPIFNLTKSCPRFIFLFTPLSSVAIIPRHSNALEFWRIFRAKKRETVKCFSFNWRRRQTNAKSISGNVIHCQCKHKQISNQGMNTILCSHFSSNVFNQSTWIHCEHKNSISSFLATKSWTRFGWWHFVVSRTFIKRIKNYIHSHRFWTRQKWIWKKKLTGKNEKKS